MSDPKLNRRKFVTAAGTATALVIAGCADESGGEGNGDENGGGNGMDDGAENGDEESNGEPIDPSETIELGAEVQAWMGQAPDQIADEENPTLVLQEGESYQFTWENLDGQEHNLEIVDDNDEVVDDYSTENMGEEGETQDLEVDEITSEMVEYVCRPHESSMRGEIQIESGNGGENGEEENGEENATDSEDGNGMENGEEENGNETENGGENDSEDDGM
ncbi:cupredoxin domain-containing protein [Natronorubrum aibiense]|uniref:Plastocyanin n=1 Tax=Natronorubrum aibiense TaxID=348826 RepID=A0A5P9P5Z5_9EURY|nr:plastocyanin/azurin family copper-binding protein [Natronorubrum aibiense]QFU83601.1 plastocyanin [Natronorubrum aibiense]